MNKKIVKARLLKHSCKDCYYGRSEDIYHDLLCTYASGGVGGITDQHFPEEMICKNWKSLPKLNIELKSYDLKVCK